jgi:integrase
VRPKSRGWRFKYRINGREKLLSFGLYPVVSLARARSHCRAAKRLLLEGIDPSDQRQARKGGATFEAVAREWYQGYSHRWAPAYAATVLRRLELHVFPGLGARRIDGIRPAELLKCLRRIEASGTLETAHRVYENCGWIFRFAVLTGRCVQDPAPSLRGSLLPTREKHLAAITNPQEFGELLRAIEGYNGSYVVHAALRLAPLVFVRPTELRAAEWSEIDMESRLWRLPATRMKMRVPHLVPLSTQALAIFEELRPSTHGRYVFPSPRKPDRPLSNVALLAALRRMGYSQGSMTVHGFRSSASTLLNEQGWRADAIERQLAHGERDAVRAAYNHAEYLQERILMMQGWANYLDELRTLR